MKLRNKETGEIRELCVDIERPDNGIRVYADDGIRYKMYNSLAELCEEWEDYEEPKEYWHIVSMCAGLQKKKDTDNGEDSFNKEIGNCFGSLEEAEKAVEKLKAWKRLQDKGFRFVEHQIHGMTEDGEGDGCAYFEFDKPLDKSELDLLSEVKDESIKV